MGLKATGHIEHGYMKEDEGKSQVNEVVHFEEGDDIDESVFSEAELEALKASGAVQEEEAKPKSKKATDEAAAEASK